MWSRRRLVRGLGLGRPVGTCSWSRHELIAGLSLAGRLNLTVVVAQVGPRAGFGSAGRNLLVVEARVGCGAEFGWPAAPCLWSEPGLVSGAGVEEAVESFCPTTLGGRSLRREGTARSFRLA